MKVCFVSVPPVKVCLVTGPSVKVCFVFVVATSESLLCVCLGHQAKLNCLSFKHCRLERSVDGCGMARVESSYTQERFVTPHFFFLS